jgi:hypothetical protein
MPYLFITKHWREKLGLNKKKRILCLGQNNKSSKHLIINNNTLTK